MKSKLALISIDFTCFLKLNTICDLKTTIKTTHESKLICQINLMRFIKNQ